MSGMKILVGCVGWNIRKEHAPHFPQDGSHLQRYAARFPLVEINTSFYRSHKPATYERWAATVPEDFRFAVKMPREITHRRRLVDFTELLEPFLDEVGRLGVKLGPILVQLPPSLNFEATVAERFFSELRARFAGDVVCEARHATWFAPDAETLLIAFQIARVAADPAAVPHAAELPGWNGLVYYRLHGTPQVYYSNYSDEYLGVLALRISQQATEAPVWCIFDNTALGAATTNALDLQRRLLSSV